MAWDGCCRGTPGHSPSSCAVPAAPTPMKPSALSTMHLLCSHLYIFLRHAASPTPLVPSLGLAEAGSEGAAALRGGCALAD